jgi:SH3 domain
MECTEFWTGPPKHVQRVWFRVQRRLHSQDNTCCENPRCDACAHSTLIYCKSIEANELAFEKGDVIKVVNREYKGWWGQLNAAREFSRSTMLCACVPTSRSAIACAYVLVVVQERLPEPIASRASSRSTAGSRHILTGDQYGSIVDDALHSRARKG